MHGFTNEDTLEEIVTPPSAALADGLARMAGNFEFALSHPRALEPGHLER